MFPPCSRGGTSAPHPEPFRPLDDNYLDDNYLDDNYVNYLDDNYLDDNYAARLRTGHREATEGGVRWPLGTAPCGIGNLLWRGGRGIRRGRGHVRVKARRGPLRPS